MSTRTTHSVARFSGEFMLAGVDQMLPAGEYSIIMDEELIEGLSRMAYRRSGTFIEVPPASGRRELQRFKIGPDDLELALRRDAAAHGNLVAVDGA